MRYLAITSFFGGRTVFDAGFRNTHPDRVLRGGDTVLELHRWESRGGMLWLFVLSKYGLVIIGCVADDEGLAWTTIE